MLHFVPASEIDMSTTIRIPEDLKIRVAAAAEKAGITARSFILQAIAEKVDYMERRAKFCAGADKRYATLVASGKTIPWGKMREFLERKIAKKPGVRPAARKPAS